MQAPLLQEWSTEIFDVSDQKVTALFCSQYVLGDQLGSLVSSEY